MILPAGLGHYVGARALTQRTRLVTLFSSVVKKREHTMRRHLCLLWGLLLACVGGASAQSETLRQELLRDTRMVLVMSILVWLGVAWTLRPLDRLRRSLRERSRDDLK
eukprot:gene30438-52572_t